MAKNDHPYIKISELNQNLEFFEQLLDEKAQRSSYIDHSLTIIGLLGIGLIFLGFVDSRLLFIGIALIVLRTYWKKNLRPEKYAIMQAKNLYRKKRFQKAIPFLHKLTVYFPGKKEILLFLGECYLRLGEETKAMNYYQEGFSTKGDRSLDKNLYDKHYVNMMYLLYNRKEWEKLIEIGSIIKDNKNREFHLELYTHYFLGVAFYCVKELSKAKKHFKKILNLDQEFKNVKELVSDLEKGKDLFDKFEQKFSM